MNNYQSEIPVGSGVNAMDLPGYLASIFRVDAIHGTRSGPETITLLIELILEGLKLFSVVFQEPFVIDGEIVVLV